MGNQQATEKCDTSEKEIAWLAGFLEGEGTLLLRQQARSEREKGNRVPKITVEIRIYNTDARLIKKCVEIVRRMDIEPCLEERDQKPLLRPGGGEYKSVDPMLVVKITKPACAIVFLRHVRPWLFGSKADRADLMIEYLERRLGRIAAEGKDPRSVPLSPAEFDVVQRFEALQRAGKNRTEGVLNE